MGLKNYRSQSTKREKIASSGQSEIHTIEIMERLQLLLLGNKFGSHNDLGEVEDKITEGDSKNWNPKNWKIWMLKKYPHGWNDQ